ncbi:MAG: hypothetical protein P8H93_03190 [Polaribacter sp.]|jgi:hypothetical protein|nr:hypothetical protein [Polaribacter sp.]
MELANIEKLVEKYLKAETTLQDEKTLRTYFKESTVPIHLQEYAYLFNYFTNTKNETFAKTIELESKKSKKSIVNWFSIAASILLLFSILIGHQAYKRHQAKKQFEQISKGLRLLSLNLKKGEVAVSSLYVFQNTQINK